MIGATVPPLALFFFGFIFLKPIAITIKATIAPKSRAIDMIEAI